MVAAYVEAAVEHKGLPVQMGRAVVSALYGYGRSPECVYQHILFNVAYQHVEAYESCRQCVAGMDDGHVKQTVVNGGFGGYVGIVAVLRGIAFLSFSFLF